MALKPRFRKYSFSSNLLLSLGLASLLLNLPLSSSSEASSRHMKKFGLYGTFLGVPAGTTWGANVAANIAGLVRISAGYGQLTPTTIGAVSITSESYGAGLGLFVPSWNFSPTVGYYYSIINATITGGSLPAGVSGSGPMHTINFGFDWQTNSGFNLGFGYQMPLIATGTSGLPYVQLGWFF